MCSGRRVVDGINPHEHDEVATVRPRIMVDYPIIVTPVVRSRGMPECHAMVRGSSGILEGVVIDADAARNTTAAPTSVITEPYSSAISGRDCPTSVKNEP